MAFIVPVSPTKTQIEAAIRVIVGWIGVAATTIGVTGLAGGLNGVLAFAGPIAAVVVFVWGQLHTRSEAKKVIALEPYAPNSVAVSAAAVKS